MKINFKNFPIYLLYILCLIPFFKPAYFSYVMEGTNQIYFMLKMISFGMAVLLLIKSFQISKFTLVLLLSQLFLLFVTIINNGNIIGMIDQVLSVCTLCILTENGLRNNQQVFLKSFITFFAVLVTINFITIILYPDGLYYSSLKIDTARNWFLGNKNVFIIYIIPLLFSLKLYGKLMNKKLNVWFWFFATISLFSLIFCWGATGIVGIVFYLIGILFENKFRKLKLFRIKNYFFSYIALFISIIILRFQNLFSYLIIDFLKKDITFTGRVYIWDFVIDVIKDSPLIGYGNEFNDFRFSKSLVYKSYHAHNQLLEFIYQGGLIYLGFMIGLIWMITGRLKKYKNSKYCFLISFTIFIYLIMMITEYYNLLLFVYIFVFAYNIGLLKE